MVNDGPGVTVSGTGRFCRDLCSFFDVLNVIFQVIKEFLSLSFFTILLLISSKTYGILVSWKNWKNVDASPPLQPLRSQVELLTQVDCYL